MGRRGRLVLRLPPAARCRASPPATRRAGSAWSPRPTAARCSPACRHSGLPGGSRWPSRRRTRPAGRTAGSRSLSWQDARRGTVAPDEPTTNAGSGRNAPDAGPSGRAGGGGPRCPAGTGGTPRAQPAREALKVLGGSVAGGAWILRGARPGVRECAPRRGRRGPVHPAAASPRGTWRRAAQGHPDRRLPVLAPRRPRRARVRARQLRGRHLDQPAHGGAGGERPALVRRRHLPAPAPVGAGLRRQHDPRALRRLPLRRVERRLGR